MPNETLKPPAPPIRRSNPPQKAHYSDYQEDLRKDFFNSCAYCSVMEREAGGVGFTIDHYIPKSSAKGKPLEHTFSNLLWSCGDCNSYKGTYLADAVAWDRGLVVIRPDTMVPSEHLELDGAAPLELRPKTTTGTFTIERLDLNRPGLQRIRSARFQIDGARKYVSEGVSALSRTALDQLKPAARGPFIKLREVVLSKAAELDQEIDELLRDYARSPLRMPDPDAKARTKARKKKLKELRVPGSSK
ncbi:MAG: HNH endonuclease [Pseudomonadota bacterium]